MNITRLNFKEAFPYLLNSISEANFVALDFQMSGIVSTHTLDPSLTDSIQTRYFKTKCKAQRFIPLQLGLCPLKITSQKIVYSPYNIYLYPLSLSEREAQQFSFNSESMRFLAKNNFDFNRLFYEGVPFISGQRVRRHQYRREELKKREEQTREYMLQSPGVAAFLGMRLREVEEWVSRGGGRQGEGVQAGEGEGKGKLAASEKNQKEIFVDIQFVRVRAYESLIYVIKKKFPSLSLQFQYLDVNRNKVQDWNFLARKYIKITKLTPEQMKTTPPDPASSTSTPTSTTNPQPQLESLALTKIFSTLKQNRIPLLVHNGFIDLMHLYHRFIDDLPSTEAAYRNGVHGQFPLIYDTKYICNNSPVLFNRLGKDTSLGNCFKLLREGERKEMEERDKEEKEGKEGKGKLLLKSEISTICSEYKLDQEEHHEAGYDALMTGYTFVNAMRVLHHPASSLTSPDFHTTVQYYSNKIPLGNIRIPYNFAEKDQQPYQQDGNKQFFFTCLQSKNTAEAPQTFMSKEKEIYEHFAGRYGPVKLIWEDKNQYNFTLSFIKVEDQGKFVKNLDEMGFALYNIDKEDRYLISTKLNRDKKLFTAQNSKN